MPGWHRRTRLIATVALATGLALGPAAASRASGVSVTDLTNSGSATTLA